MSSIYQQVLGADFERLHPQIQRRFGFGTEDGVASIGRGVMDEVWRGPWWTLPFLVIGSWRRIMFPERGRDIPFTIENYAFVDRFGRETVSWIRTFETPRGKRRRFDAYMIVGRNGHIVDYMGSHEHLAVDLEMRVDDGGGLTIRSGHQRFYEHAIAFRWPMLFTGVAEVREWYDDADACFRIDVAVRNQWFGRLFGYRGRFQAEWVPVHAGEVPAHILPIRQEARE
ncbi:MAG TPA: DUF4166 domain-containing protein [Candidatus Limnocylindrales bacterium]|nr:DUF4166 domain-containing protein [Candidatus Limnocylindrales bacterium]